MLIAFCLSPLALNFFSEEAAHFASSSDSLRFVAPSSEFNTKDRYVSEAYFSRGEAKQQFFIINKVSSCSFTVVFTVKLEI